MTGTKDPGAPSSRYNSAFFTALNAADVEQALDDAELHRRCVAYAITRAVGEVEGFFGEGSSLWRIFGDPVISAGAVRAVALQIAHPAIAAAGIQHSTFREDFIGRAWRTYATMSELVFGDLSAACAASERLHVLHAMVRGSIPAEASPARAGASYRATDPELLCWVLATLYEASVFAYELLVHPMTEPERASYYEDMRLLGALIGIPSSVMPDGIDGFQRYWDQMLEQSLEVGPASRELMAFLLGSSLTRLSRWTQIAPLVQLDEAWVKMVIPVELATALGVEPNRRDRRSFAILTRILRLITRALPDDLRRTPAHHQAVLRVRSATGGRTPWVGRAVESINRRTRLPMSLRPVKPLTGDSANLAVDLIADGPADLPGAR